MWPHATGCPAPSEGGRGGRTRPQSLRGEQGLSNTSALDSGLRTAGECFLVALSPPPVCSSLGRSMPLLSPGEPLRLGAVPLLRRAAFSELAEGDSAQKALLLQEATQAFSSVKPALATRPSLEALGTQVSSRG